jgi:hypothetical protein
MGRSQTLVTHTYNPSFSRGRDQEDRGSKPAQANSLKDSFLKNTNNNNNKKIQNRDGKVAQDPEFKPEYCKINK